MPGEEKARPIIACEKDTLARPTGVRCRMTEVDSAQQAFQCPQNCESIPPLDEVAAPNPFTHYVLT